MPGGYVRAARVVLAPKVDAHARGSYEVLQGGTVVEVVVAGSSVGPRGQQAESDVAMAVRDVTEKYKIKRQTDIQVDVQIDREMDRQTALRWTVLYPQL